MYKNLAELFWSKIQKNQNRTLFSFKTNDTEESDYILEKKITWQEAANITKSIASVLTNYQTEKSSTVIIWAGTSSQWILADLAILSLGAITVPVFPSASTNELKQALDLTKVRTIFVQNSFYLEQLIELLEQKDFSTELENIIVFEEDDKYPSLSIKLDRYNLASWNNLFSDEQNHDEIEGIINNNLANLDRDDTASIIFSSGTTGKAKAVELSHGNILAAIEGFKDLVPITKSDKYLSILPLSHIFERTACEFYALYVGAQISFPLNYKNFANELREDGITIVNLVPRMLEKLYEIIETRINTNIILRNLIKIPAIDYIVCKLIKVLIAPKLRFFISGGAALNPNLANKLKQLGFISLQGYGLTETSGGITVNPAKDYRFTSVGKVINGAEIKIADDGEIICTGPSVFDSYYQNEEANQNAFLIKDSKKWFKTGDLGSIDKDGYLTITGRKKDLIVSSYGKKIQINKLEALLETIPYISQSILIGENRKFITALIRIDQVKLNSNKVKIEDILYEDIKKLNQRLARHEQIKKFTVIDRDFSIAKDEVTATLKLKRTAIEKNFAKEIEAMYKESRNAELLNND